jgi:hypothetical protein
MTIEIKQLIIRAVVEDRRERTPGAVAPRNGAAPELTQRPLPAAAATVDREALIAECTRQVLRELRKGRGR